VQLAPCGGYDVLVSAGVVQQSQHVAAIHLKKGGVHCSLVFCKIPSNAYLGRDSQFMGYGWLWMIMVCNPLCR